MDLRTCSSRNREYEINMRVKFSNIAKLLLQKSMLNNSHLVRATYSSLNMRINRANQSDENKFLHRVS